jgi:hypothetical protein
MSSFLCFKRQILAFCAFCALFCSPKGFADTIVSNLGAGNTFNGTLGGLDVQGNEVQYAAVAEIFTSSGNFEVTQIDTGLVYQNGTNSAVVSLWTDSAGQPGTELGSWNASNFPISTSLSSTTSSLSGGQIIAGITGVEVLAGQHYFLEVAPGASDTGLTWFEQTTAGGSAMYGQLDSPTAAWEQQAGDPDGAYAVFGNTFVPVSTPEPASIVLVLAGLAVCFCPLKKKRHVSR